MQIKIDEIAIPERVRQTLGDLSQLMRSMQTHGQLNPIVITPDYQLIAGHRRLESGKRLGWPSINAVIINDLDEIAKLEIEIDENVHREPLSGDELADAFDRLEKLKRPAVGTRVWRGVKGFFRKIFVRSDKSGRIG